MIINWQPQSQNVGYSGDGFGLVFVSFGGGQPYTPPEVPTSGGTYLTMGIRPDPPVRNLTNRGYYKIP